MLCLSRKDREAVIVRKDGVEILRVCVVRIDGNKVRIGFEADESIEIVREEIAGTPKDHPNPHAVESTGA